MPLRLPATAFAFAVAFAFIAITGVVLYQARTVASQAAIGHSDNLAITLQREIDRDVERLDLSLMSVVANHALVEQQQLDPDLRQEVVHNGMLPATDFIAVVVLDDHGVPVFNSRSPPSPQPSFAERDYFKTHRDHPDAGLLMTLIERTYLANEPIIALSRRINHPDGSFAGVAAGAIELSTFKKLFGSLHIGERGCLVLLAADGRDVYRTNSGNTYFALDPALRDTLGEQDGQPRMVWDVDGVLRLFTRYQLRTVPLSINVGLAADDIYESWWVATGIASAAAALLLTFAASLTRDLRWELTRRERMELALRDSEANFRLLAQHGSDMVTRVGPDGERRYVSPASLRLLHASPDRLLGQSLRQYVHADDRPALKTAATKLLAGCSLPEPITFRVTSVGGSERWMEAVGQPLLHPVTRKPDGYVSAWRDVTSRKQAERQLAESEARYRLLAETAADLITCLDLQLRRTYVSPSCRTVLGFEPEEMMTLTPAGATHPDELAAVGERFMRLTLGEVDRDIVTTRIRHKNGHYIWVEVKLALIRDPETRQPVGIMSVIRDVTERKAQADALVEANAELERLAQHLATARDAAEQASRAKSRFLANVSHELRTPLYGIVGYAQLLQITGGLSPGQVTRVGGMLMAGRRLVEMIDAVLELSEVEAGGITLDPAPVQLAEVIATCVDAMRPDAERKSLALAAQLAADAPETVVVDAKRLRQILLNLLGNAIKLTGHGAVQVRAQRWDGTTLRIEVADNGPGISVLDRTRLFCNLDRLGGEMALALEGAGLGLALSSRLATAMGGALGHRDNDPRGSVFWIDLPLSPAPPLTLAQGGAQGLAQGGAQGLAQGGAQGLPQGGAQDGLHLPGSARGLHTLVVDDVAINRKVVAAFLSDAGHQVTCAEGGQEAVLLASTSDFDVILMNVRMPDRDGLEAARRIRSFAGPRGRVPIIAVVEQAFAEEIARFRDAGIDHHLATPFTRPSLLEALQRAVAAAEVT